MKLETKRYYDDETMEFIAAKWFVDGGEVSFDEYMDIVDGLEEYNNDENDVENVEEVSDECEEWKECEEVVCDKCDEGITYDELLDEFVERIQNTEGCPSCIREILNEFADIFIPEEDEEINE